jgi:hypothetical protein
MGRRGRGERGKKAVKEGGKEALAAVVWDQEHDFISSTYYNSY